MTSEEFEKYEKQLRGCFLFWCSFLACRAIPARMFYLILGGVFKTPYIYFICHCLNAPKFNINKIVIKRA